ncbi:hypothetical protein H920_11497 [Fukomys damarensis]|uniref:Uncharacterized protein n=1 Tax=Fukomys damarensis TaxID=885580 RepID=A0A091D7P1_FUKDA|nr:hypothetical protein H920_11497 [Fukomys damarensis]
MEGKEVEHNLLRHFVLEAIKGVCSLKEPPATRSSKNPGSKPFHYREQGSRDNRHDDEGEDGSNQETVHSTCAVSSERPQCSRFLCPGGGDPASSQQVSPFFPHPISP